MVMMMMFPPKVDQTEGYYVPQVAWGYTHQGGLSYLRQHHPLLQPAGGTVPAADAGGVGHRWYVPHVFISLIIHSIYLI